MAAHDKTAALTAATDWHKSSYSGQNTGCVEVGTVAGVIGVRDTKLQDRSPVVAFTDVAWARFIRSIE